MHTRTVNVSYSNNNTWVKRRRKDKGVRSLQTSYKAEHSITTHLYRTWKNKGNRMNRKKSRSIYLPASPVHDPGKKKINKRRKKNIIAPSSPTHPSSFGSSAVVRDQALSGWLHSVTAYLPPCLAWPPTDNCCPSRRFHFLVHQHRRGCTSIMWPTTPWSCLIFM